MSPIPSYYYHPGEERPYAETIKPLHPKLARWMIESNATGTFVRERLSQHYGIPIPEDSEEAA